MIGDRLLHYEITAKLGEGGMGAVYRAQDTRLDREVAIKVLLPEVASSSEFLARFDREARAISSLNHPNICTLYDVGEESGTHFLVMEFIDGESLADRLEKGPLPLEEVLRYGAQISRALDQAHKQGIVHRDLKPGNIMLTRSGVKLLDFGLARTEVESEAAEGLTAMATEAQPLTKQGVVLGTFQYMAPEQLESLEADARTDIFSLGALLYEMATGRRAFGGSTRASLIADIISSQPQPISSVMPMTPPALDHVVRRCLEKDPEDRWQNAHDIAGELRWIGEAGSVAGVPAATVSSRRLRRRALTAAAAAGWTLTAAAVAWILLGPRPSGESLEPFRSDLIAPEDLAFSDIGCGNIRVSPSGDRLAFRAAGPDGPVLVVKDFASGEVLALDGARDPCFIFWSADGRSLAFFEGGKLRKVAAGGGPVQTVTDVPAGRGGTWNQEGAIVYAPDIYGALMWVPDSGGTPQQVTTLSGDELTHRNPHFLPDGKHFLFNRRSEDGLSAGIALGSLDGGPHTTVLEKGSNPQWADGHLFFTRERNLMVQRFDPGKLEIRGPAVPIAAALDYYNPRDVANYSVSGDGLLVYRQSHPREAQLTWYGLDGRELATVGEAALIEDIRSISRDRSRVAVKQTGEDGVSGDIWVMDLERGQMTRATFVEAKRNIYAVLSSTGDRLAVANVQGGAWLQSSSGAGAREELGQVGAFSPNDWSPDGRYLVGDKQEAATGFDVVYIDLEGGRELRPFTASQFEEVNPRLSPDGKWIAYTSNESGRPEVYLADFPLGHLKWQISVAGGDHPRWYGDDRIHYQTREALLEVSLGPGDQRKVAAPEVLITWDQFSSSLVHIEERIGDRFLGVKHPSEPKPEPLRLIRNWKSLLGG